MEEKTEKAANAEAPKDGAAAAELARVRSSNRLFKAAAIVLSALFALLLCVVLFMYHKFSGLKDLLLPPSGTFQDSAFRTGEEGLPGIPPEGFNRFAASTQTQGGSSLTVFTNTGEYAQASAVITAEDAEKTARVFARYADRPIVKEFLAELKKDPDFARALKEKDVGNPLAMLASLQKIKGMQGLVLKFAIRKDFLPLMMEFMNDPDMKPLLGKLPMGNLGPGAQMMKLTPGSARSPAPAMARPENDAVPDMVPDEPVRLDSSAMQRPAPSAGTGLKKKTPPLPGD